MSAAAAYQRKLRDPRWQRRRLEILDRAGWICECCGEAEKELHVHHRVYPRGKEPWEATSEALEALCKDCHSREEAVKRRIRVALDHLSVYGHSWILETVCGYLEAEVNLSAIPIGPVRPQDHSEAEGAAQAIGVGVDELIEVLLAGSVVDGSSVADLFPSALRCKTVFPSRIPAVINDGERA